ncbi:MAG: hypothetical protein ACRDKG_10065 [Actinomycetota bacterium]
MRRTLIGLILILLIVMPLSALAGGSEELCTGVEVRVYGKKVPLVPELCVPCTFDLCAAILDKCPDALCAQGAPYGQTLKLSRG